MASMAKYANYFQLVVFDLEAEFRDESHIKLYVRFIKWSDSKVVIHGLTRMLVKEVVRM